MAPRNFSIDLSNCAVKLIALDIEMLKLPAKLHKQHKVPALKGPANDKICL